MQSYPVHPIWHFGMGQTLRLLMINDSNSMLYDNPKLRIYSNSYVLWNKMDTSSVSDGTSLQVIQLFHPAW